MSQQYQSQRQLLVDFMNNGSRYQPFSNYKLQSVTSERNNKVEYQNNKGSHTSNSLQQKSRKLFVPLNELENKNRHKNVYLNDDIDYYQLTNEKESYSQPKSINFLTDRYQSLKLNEQNIIVEEDPQKSYNNSSIGNISYLKQPSINSKKLQKKVKEKKFLKEIRDLLESQKIITQTKQNQVGLQYKKDILDVKQMKDSIKADEILPTNKKQGIFPKHIFKVNDAIFNKTTETIAKQENDKYYKQQFINYRDTSYFEELASIHNNKMNSSKNLNQKQLSMEDISKKLKKVNSHVLISPRYMTKLKFFKSKNEKTQQNLNDSKHCSSVDKKNNCEISPFKQNTIHQLESSNESQEREQYSLNNKSNNYLLKSPQSQKLKATNERFVVEKKKNLFNDKQIDFSLYKFNKNQIEKFKDLSSNKCNISLKEKSKTRLNQTKIATPSVGLYSPSYSQMDKHSMSIPFQTKHTQRSQEKPLHFYSIQNEQTNQKYDPLKKISNSYQNLSAADDSIQKEQQTLQRQTLFTNISKGDENIPKQNQFQNMKSAKNNSSHNQQQQHQQQQQKEEGENFEKVYSRMLKEIKRQVDKDRARSNGVLFKPGNESLRLQLTLTETDVENMNRQFNIQSSIHKDSFKRSMNKM